MNTSRGEHELHDMSRFTSITLWVMCNKPFQATTHEVSILRGAFCDKFKTRETRETKKETKRAKRAKSKESGHATRRNGAKPSAVTHNADSETHYRGSQKGAVTHVRG